MRLIQGAMMCALATVLGACAVPPRVAVIAHRGEHLSHPENTLPAFEGAIAAGADYFECDVRTTSDGQLVLMHDSTVDRTTSGSGKVESLTLGQIRELDAGAKFAPAFTGTRVPTFAEALALAKGRINVYVDNKQTQPAALVKAIEDAGMGEHVVIYGGEELLEIHRLRPAWRVMPEADSPEALTAAIKAADLRVAAFDAGDFNDATIAVAHTHHVAIYVDRLGKADTPEAWQDAVDRGAAGIQTDHPAALVEVLHSRGLHAGTP
ncbi:MAG: glycerophosphodiester phosphodiesterase family protein [Phycisphaerales bacterium]|jgi:glycerophosphoryl diester phosphodiesterase